MRFLNGLAAGATALALSLAAGGVAHANLPWGAEQGGNADGSIPAWTGPGGITTINGVSIVDPFPGDQPILVIDQSNVSQYRDNLTAGQIAMLEKHASYKIPVYQTRRIFDLPSDFKSFIGAEAGRISLAGDTGLKGLDRSPVPFPAPQNGLQAIWNHITRYRAGKITRNYWQVPVQANGNYTAQSLTDRIIFRAALDTSDPENENMLIKFLQVFNAPAQVQGNVLLVHEFIDQVRQPRAAWLYNPGQRRVRRAPNVAYDGPATGAEGLRTFDDFDMYNGSPNKYTWKLLGKREMFTPANGFRYATASGVDQVLGPKHMNPDLARYEKRRVWVVEANLKPSERHIYSRRVFYLDEDGWVIALADQYDDRGQLWRHKELHSAFFSTTKSQFNTAEAIYDLRTGRYLMLSNAAGFDLQLDLNADISEAQFTPSALRRAGR
ncbi:MAG: DUF1329 domain-containing protein [Pseudomonadota bacterium]